MGKKGKGKGGGGGGGADGAAHPVGSPAWLAQQRQAGQPSQGGQAAGPATGLGRGQAAGPAAALGRGQAAGPAAALGRGQAAGPAAALGRGQAAGPAAALGRGQAAGPAASLGRGQAAGPAAALGRGQADQFGRGRGRGQDARPPGHLPSGPRPGGPGWAQGPPAGQPWSADPRPLVSGPPPRAPPPVSSEPPSRAPAFSGPPSRASAPTARAQPLSSGGSSGDAKRPTSGKSCQAIIELPQRANCPPEGKDGLPIQLEVNHLLLQIKDPNTMICHYDVTIDPDKPKRFMRPVMRAMQSKCYPRNAPGFDGRKNLYSRGILPFGREIFEEVQVVDDERQDQHVKSFKVTLKLVRENLSLQELFAYQRHGQSSNPPQDIIQAVDVILRSASAQSFIQVGRSFFCPPERPYDLGTGMELWLGFFQSFIMGQKPYLNIDVAHKGFPRAQNIVDLLRSLDPRARSFEDIVRYKMNDLERFIKGLKIEYKIPQIESSKRVYRVNGLRKNAMQERFTPTGEGTITIGEYFEKRHRYRLAYPQLPCIHVGPREKEIVVPMELCTIIGGQAVQKKLDDTQTAAMVKAAATNVSDRKNKIKQAMQRANLNASKECAEFGLSVANNFAKVSGRILPPPKLQYKRGNVQPSRGVWRGGSFLQSRHLQRWICVDTCQLRERDALSGFCQNLVHEAQSLDMMMERPDPAITLNSKSPRFKADLMNTFQDLRRQGYELVLVVISGFNKQVYGQVKQLAEIQVGILTQCIKDNTITRRNNQATVHNVMLKINAKFNGINQVIVPTPKIKCLSTKILVFGADVTHPSPDSQGIPSVAAVTASHDLRGFQYNMQIRLQPPRQEVITDLCNIVHAQLNIYKNEVGELPERILFYRDGVSEGQFQQVLSQELQAIYEACSRFNYKPKVTLLVVQKRHHTRFFPLDPKVSQDKNGNVPAGTIVDTEITHPTEIDFYLVSHASIQGVARPTKYHVLRDDANMSENEIQLLTYSLCHLFTRCDRAVSYPAPTYYAHLAASRGRVYLEGRNIALENLERESSHIQTALNFTKTSPMYFV